MSDPVFSSEERIDLVVEVQGVADGVSDMRGNVVGVGNQHLMLLMARQLECIARIMATRCSDCPICTGQSKN